ncbi:MAG TPA: nitronate monooxygenase, partial [Acidimicrobiia bacterium]|nr:nitronate monooxygenase [Acidimicrobiia bacterium]
DAAAGARVGCGFITWSLAKRPELLDLALGRSPVAVMLSFGPLSPFADRIKSAGAALICQVQTLSHAREAVAAGVDVIVAQGAEAGGHGSVRGTFTLVAEVADYLAEAAPEVPVAAAGGIADGRGLAAALMLGAAGVLVGTRFWASSEAAVPPGFHAAALAADGDSTVRSTVPDVVRGLEWPSEFTARGLRTPFVAEWLGREDELAAPDHLPRERERYTRAAEAGDVDNCSALVGEAIGLIHDIVPAGDIVRRMAEQAERLLKRR